MLANAAPGASGEFQSPFYVNIEVDDRPGVLAHVAERLAAEEVSIARLTQHQLGDAAALDIVTHEARSASVEAALAAIAGLEEVRGRPAVMPVIARSDR